MNGLISDVKITDSKLAREAAELVRQHETEMFANDPTRLAYPRRICDRHRGLHDRRAASCHCARFERRAGRCYTYIGVFLASVAGFDPRGLALALLGFGIASALGSRLGGTAFDRVGARITVAVCGDRAFIAYIILWIGAAIEQRQAIVVVRPALLLWGLAMGFDDNATGSARRGVSGTSTGQPLTELVGHIPRQRNWRVQGGNHRCRWRNRAVGISRGGVQLGCATAGLGR
jgi:hypothetical protein